MPMPEASVIIPAYNAQKHIAECLLSLKGQTFKDFEVIVVDDGSCDQTPEVAASYAKVVRLAKKTGVGSARNAGAREAKAEVLVFTDADVVLPKEWLFNILEDMRARKVKCVGGPYRGSLGNSFMEKFAYLELAHRRKDMPEFVTTIVANNFALSRDVFFEFGGFPEKFKCEDLRLSFQISKKYPIYWDRANGVYHHFKASLKDYLNQQYYFGRDTVWSYYQYPEMLKSQTHQGRLLYWETLFMFFLFVSLLLRPKFAIIFSLLILIINFKFLLFLKKEGLSLPKSYLVILARDFICVLSIFSGIALCLKDAAVIILKRKQRCK